MYPLLTSIWNGGPSPAGEGHVTDVWLPDASLFHNRGELSTYLNHRTPQDVRELHACWQIKNTYSIYQLSLKTTVPVIYLESLLRMLYIFSPSNLSTHVFNGSSEKLIEQDIFLTCSYIMNHNYVLTRNRHRINL